MTTSAPAPKTTGGTHEAPRTWDVFPVYTRRTFPARLIWSPSDGWNPYLDHRKPFAELTPSFHVYTGDHTGTLNIQYTGAPCAPGQVCLRFTPYKLDALAGMTCKHTGIPNEGGKHGSSPYEEYICDFSTYKGVGKFHFRYWLATGQRYKVMAKVDAVEITGSGRWETVVIAPLGKELFTHHTLLWLQNLQDAPADIFIDDAFFFKGAPPADSIVTMELKPAEQDR